MLVWEGIPLGITELGPWALLILAVTFMFISLFRGWVIVKLHYVTLVERANHLQETVDTLRETNQIQARTIEKQTAVGETVVRVISSLQDSREGST